MDPFLLEIFKPLSIGVVVAGFVAIVSILFPYYMGEPWIPSEMEDVRKMLKLANIQPGELWDYKR